MDCIIRSRRSAGSVSLLFCSRASARIVCKRSALVTADWNNAHTVAVVFVSVMYPIAMVPGQPPVHSFRARIQAYESMLARSSGNRSRSCGSSRRYYSFQSEGQWVAMVAKLAVKQQIESQRNIVGSAVDAFMWREFCAPDGLSKSQVERRHNWNDLTFRTPSLGPSSRRGAREGAGLLASRGFPPPLA
jgi:hypothetical protein